MTRNIVFLIVVATLLPVILNAQRIFYSEPDRNEQRTMSFDIAGKINNHYLIYKNNKSDNYISVFDGEMKLIENVDINFMPDKLLGSDIIAYKDFFYLFYQYQKRSIAYCMVAKMDGDGKIVGNPIQLDTTHINSFTNNRIYNIINSEDKLHIMAFKINSKNADNYILTTSLFDNDLKLYGKSRVNINMPERSDFLSEFALDNESALVFLRAAGTNENDNIKTLSLIIKQPAEDSISIHNIEVPDIYLDDVKVKINNINRNYLIASFYSKVRRGNIDGLYCALWDKKYDGIVFTNHNTFSEEMRQDAKTDGNTKFAFNNFYIKNILMRRDGGFVIASESVYSSSRGGYNNSRWDYGYGSSFSRPSDYYLYNSPFYNSYYNPWSRYGNFGSYQMNRYFADNIVVLSFDSTANLKWNNIIHKSQYDDNSDDFIGYGTFNTGGKFHFLFNQSEKKTQLLTDQSITPDGEINRSPTLHNLSKEYQFMPRNGKQVSSYELVVPCQYRNYICFAKIEY
ncbi:hypothetical protein BH11BAC6_BH11BAC6_13680 [soil metagenome]